MSRCRPVTKCRLTCELPAGADTVTRSIFGQDVLLTHRSTITVTLAARLSLYETRAPPASAAATVDGCTATAVSVSLGNGVGVAVGVDDGGAEGDTEVVGAGELVTTGGGVGLTVGDGSGWGCGVVVTGGGDVGGTLGTPIQPVAEDVPALPQQKRIRPPLMTLHRGRRTCLWQVGPGGPGGRSPG